MRLEEATAGQLDAIQVGSRVVRVRPVTAADASRLVELHTRCSHESRYFRFHASKPRLRTAEAQYLAAVDGVARVAFAATVVEDGEERIVADARFDITGDDAEAALLVRDDHAGCGLGRLLLGRLLEVAAGLGVRRVVLDILPENRAMLALARRVGAEPVGFDGRSVLYAVALASR